MKKFVVEENWSWRNLKLKKLKLKIEVEKFEVEKIWSWKNLKLKKFEVDEIWSWKIWSWRNLKLTNFNLKNLKLKKFELGVRFKTFLELIYEDKQRRFWKYSLIFLFSISPHFGPLLHFFGAFRGYLMVLWGYFMALWDYYWWRCQVQNQFLELTNEVNQLWFWKYCPIFFVFNSAKFGTLFALLRPLGAIFGVGVRLKNFFGTYLHRLTTFILEV